MRATTRLSVLYQNVLVKSKATESANKNKQRLKTFQSQGRFSRERDFLVCTSDATRRRNQTNITRGSSSSDGHGFENPCGFAGTGLTGTGAGHQIVTRDIPVPVWAGDGL